MTTLKHIFALVIFLSLGFNAFAQVKVECTIENQMISGSDFFFDIYLKTTTGTSGDLYLDNADFVLMYNHANFTNPVLSKVSNPSPPLGVIQNGYCTFVSVSNTDPTALATNASVQVANYDRTSTTINASDELIINLNGAAPTDQTFFDDKVGKIDGTASTHRLGRFKISGISNTNGTAGIMWKGAGVGLRTKVFTLTTTTPWTSSQVASGDLTLTNPSNISLPVEMTSFDAVAIGEMVELSWTTATEINTDHFEIQKSYNAGHWMPIGKEDAAGNSLVFSFYKFIDAEPKVGNNYYRLKMVDNDGTFDYSEVKVVKMDGELVEDVSVSIYPNPVTDILNVKFDTAIQIGQIRVYDAKGANVYSAVTDLSNKQKAALNLSVLPSGFYMLSILTGDEIISKKFIKK